MRKDISDRFTPKFLDHLDGRTKAAQILKARLDELHSDLGGEDALSYVKKSLCKRALWLEAFIESLETRAAEGEEINVGAQVQALNSLVGIYRTIGLERQAANVPTIKSWVQEQKR